MTIFSPQKFHQKAKNPRKLPIYPKFDVPKVPEVYREIQARECNEGTGRKNLGKKDQLII